MDRRIYIKDFCEDLNYQGFILYIGYVPAHRLLKVLERDNVNKLYRLEYAMNKEDISQRNYIYVENCDLQDLDYPIHDYIESNYDVYVLYEDNGEFYVKKRL